MSKIFKGYALVLFFSKANLPTKEMFNCSFTSNTSAHRRTKTRAHTSQKITADTKLETVGAYPCRTMMEKGACSGGYQGACRSNSESA